MSLILILTNLKMYQKFINNITVEKLILNKL